MKTTENKKTRKSNIPNEQWLIYNNIVKAHPDWSKKRALTVAGYAYRSRYAVETEQG
jgi:hypothetical protein